MVYFVDAFSGRCVPLEWVCDGEADCPGREDEARCGAERAPAPCQATYFRCPDARCVPGRWRCDGEDDCGDGADEMRCEPRACSESEFRCASGECIRGALRCSGVAECADASDERACGACGPGARACASGRCVRLEWWCDGEPDCEDAGDELTCGARDEAGCAPPAWRCDGRADCAGGRDELPAACAAHACPLPMFRCVLRPTATGAARRCEGTHVRFPADAGARATRVYRSIWCATGSKIATEMRIQLSVRTGTI